MPAAWTCIKEPERHGSFLQLGLDTLSALYGAVQPSGRFACPVCMANGQRGDMRAATQAEVEKIELQGA